MIQIINSVHYNKKMSSFIRSRSVKKEKLYLIIVEQLLFVLFKIYLIN